MKEITKCPSTLALGYSAYSPIAIKRLFDGKKVSPYLGFEIEEIAQGKDAMLVMKRISVSGAQEKFPAVVDHGVIRLSEKGERSWYILKPAPWDNTLYTRKQIPAN